MLSSQRFLVSLTILAITSAAAAQIAPASQEPAWSHAGPAAAPLSQQAGSSSQGSTVHFSDGGAGGRMESIFIPPKARAPFSMTLSTEWSKPVSGGGNFTLVNERHIMRDSNGRIYQERWWLVPKGGEIKSQMNVFQITDPHQHTWYNCVTQTKVCDLYYYRLSATEKFEPSLRPSGPLGDGRGFVQSDDLGMSTTAGVETHGYRQVTTFNPGAMGNDKEMTATREFWYSPQLAVNLLSIVDQPSSGKQVFRVTELSTSEPDPAFFEVPAEYKVVDRRETDGRD